MIPKNAPYRVGISMTTTAGAADTTTTPVCSVALDDGNLAACTNAPVRRTLGGAATNRFWLLLTAEEMNADMVDILTTGAGCVPQSLTLYPEATWTSVRAGYLDAGISTRSSHSAADVKSAVEAAGSSLAAIITHLTQIKGAGFATQSLVAIKEFIDSIILKTQNLPADPASNTQVNTRMAGADYVEPDNTGIANALTAANTAASNAADAQAAAAAVGLDLDAVKAKTDQLTFTVENKVDASASVDVNEQGIADAVIAGINLTGDGKVLLTDTYEYPLGTPVVGATVTLCTDSAGLEKGPSDITNDLGVFSFYVVPGDYWLHIQYPGHENQLIYKQVTA